MVGWWSYPNFDDKWGNCCVIIPLYLFNWQITSNSTNSICVLKFWQHSLWLTVYNNCSGLKKSYFVADSDSNHQVVDCAQQLLIEHSYWPIVSDLINLLAHRDIALYFMNDKKLLKFWAKIISCFQGKLLSLHYSGFAFKHVVDFLSIFMINLRALSQFFVIYVVVILDCESCESLKNILISVQYCIIFLNWWKKELNYGLICYLNSKTQCRVILHLWLRKAHSS
jgi:hypothetical protein